VARSYSFKASIDGLKAELYLTLVLNSREKPPKALSEAFQPLLKHTVHEEFGKLVLPASVKDVEA